METFPPTERKLHSFIILSSLKLSALMAGLYQMKANYDETALKMHSDGNASAKLHEKE